MFRSLKEVVGEKEERRVKEKSQGYVCGEKREKRKEEIVWMKKNKEIRKK